MIEIIGSIFAWIFASIYILTWIALAGIILFGIYFVATRQHKKEGWLEQRYDGHD